MKRLISFFASLVGNKTSIKRLISQKNWDPLIVKYSPDELCKILNFSEAMGLVNHLIYDDFRNDDRQQYALKLLHQVKESFSTKWEKDWKNDVFMGDLCCHLYLYDERYFYYKRAYDKLTDPPAELLLCLSRCNSAPGVPPITDQEAEGYLRRSIEKKITYESALSMRSLYRNGDSDQYKYWDEVYQDLQKKGVHSEYMIPDVLIGYI